MTRTNTTQVGAGRWVQGRARITTLPDWRCRGVPRRGSGAQSLRQTTRACKARAPVTPYPESRRCHGGGTIDARMRTTTAVEASSM
jgi:hypothetical protein